MELDSPDMYPRTLEEIKAETEADPTLSVLCAFVAHGWPCDKSQVPTALLHYYPLRDELAVDHGVLYKSHKVLIPAKLQSTILKTLHHGHQGGESMIYRAREVMYWSVMQAGTFKMVSNVHCVLAMVSTPKGTDVVSWDSKSPWIFISQHLFKQGGRWYSVTVDHYSDWFEVDLLNKVDTVANVISVTKAHFARYGITGFCQTVDLSIPLRNLWILPRPIVFGKLPGNRIMQKLPVMLELPSRRPTGC